MKLRDYLPTGFPIIVTLCGSTKFSDAYLEAQRRLTLEGKIVISVGLFGHKEALDMGGPVKAGLDELHLRKIDLSDEIFVINCKVPYCLTCDEFRNKSAGCSRGCLFAGALRPYIGESTRREIEYATRTGKTVRYLED